VRFLFGLCPILYRGSDCVVGVIMNAFGEDVKNERGRRDLHISHLHVKTGTRTTHIRSRNSNVVCITRLMMEFSRAPAVRSRRVLGLGSSAWALKPDVSHGLGREPW
jgi:hypothetical protein